MNDVTIGAYSMQTNFGLYLPEYTIPAPTPQTKFVDIIGRDGPVDLSNAFGVMHYGARKWTLNFKTFEPVNWHTLTSNVMNAIHGKRLDFVFDADPSYKWTGRFNVKNYSTRTGEGTLQVEITSDPYKLKTTATTVTSAAGTVTLSNSSMPVVPTITATATMGLEWTYNGATYTASVSSGTSTVPQLVLYEGDTVVTVTGSGSVTFTYTEGSL